MTRTATPNTITIGDTITYVITSKTQQAQPIDQKTLKPFTVLGKETRTLGDTTTHTYFLTLYETGDYTLPAHENQASIPIKVNSVLTTENATPIDIYPIIPQSFFPWEILILLLALGTASFTIYVKNKKRKESSANTQSKSKKINPHTWAKKELTKLKKQKLTEKNIIPSHYIKLSHILKFYLSGEFEDALIESTTHETLTKLSQKLDTETKKRLKNILNLCDKVKFAEYKPTGTENKNSIPKTETIIETIHDTRKDKK